MTKSFCFEIKKAFTKQPGLSWCELGLGKPWDNRCPELTTTRGSRERTSKSEAGESCAAWSFQPPELWTLGWRLTVLSANLLYRAAKFPPKFLSLSCSWYSKIDALTRILSFFYFFGVLFFNFMLFSVLILLASVHSLSLFLTWRPFSQFSW